MNGIRLLLYLIEIACIYLCWLLDPWKRMLKNNTNLDCMVFSTFLNKYICFSTHKVPIY